jgi:hypothetical protein
MHPLRSYGRIRLGGHISEGLADGVVMMPMKSSHDIRSGKRRFDYVVLGLAAILALYPNRRLALLASTCSRSTK